MKFSNRAAAIAAAAALFAGASAFADPVSALDLDAGPMTARYIDHSVATMDAALMVSSSPLPTTPAPAADFASPEAEHAEPVAPLKTEARAASLSELVEEHADVETDDSEHDCLASAVYFEAKGEPLEGQLAVAEVVLNRAASGKYPESVCGVVTQRSQFSFVRGGRIPTAPKASAAWRKAVAIAHIAAEDLAESRSADAMSFHARRVSPRWRGMERVATIGNHIFYR